MKRWKIFVTFFKKLYDIHYTVDCSFNSKNFTFVKVNEEYVMDLSDNELDYDIFVEHDFTIYEPNLQKKGYHESSVLYHVYKNNVHNDFDYIGFIEYDHVLRNNLTEDIQRMIDSADHDLLFVFNKFTFHQYWEQGILMNPLRPQKETGGPHSKWNCINVILKDYNKFFGTNFRLQDLIRKDSLPICHCFMMPSANFNKIMRFHSYIIDSGKVNHYHKHNWRAPAGLMERYLAVELALEDCEIVDSIQLEHRSYPIKVLQPNWFKPTLYQKLMRYIQKHI